MEEDKHSLAPKFLPPLKAISWILLGVAVVFTLVMLFAGRFTVVTGENGIEVDAVLCKDIRIPYADIESVQMLDSVPRMSRRDGYASVGISMGRYESADLGTVYRYTHHFTETMSLIVRCAAPCETPP